MAQLESLERTGRRGSLELLGYSLTVPPGWSRTAVAEAALSFAEALARWEPDGGAFPVFDARSDGAPHLYAAVLTSHRKGALARADYERRCDLH